MTIKFEPYMIFSSFFSFITNFKCHQPIGLLNLNQTWSFFSFITNYWEKVIEIGPPAEFYNQNTETNRKQWNVFYMIMSWMTNSVPQDEEGLKKSYTIIESWAQISSNALGEKKE